MHWAGKGKVWLAVGFLAVAFCPGPRAWGEAIKPSLTFSTSALVTDPGRISGTPVVSLQGASSNTLFAPLLYQPGQTINPVPDGYGATAPLGQLMIATPPAGTTTTYNNVPFDLLLNVSAANGDPSAAPPGPEMIKGFLNGTVSSTGGTNLTLDFLTTSSSSPLVPDALAGAFNAGGLTYSLTLPGGGSFSLPPGTSSGSIPITGVFLAGPTVPAPEPASIAAFAVLCMGLAVQRARTMATRKASR